MQDLNDAESAVFKVKTGCNTWPGTCLRDGLPFSAANNTSTACLWGTECLLWIWGPTGAWAPTLSSPSERLGSVPLVKYPGSQCFGRNLEPFPGLGGGSEPIASVWSSFRILLFARPESAVFTANRPRHLARYPLNLDAPNDNIKKDIGVT